MTRASAASSAKYLSFDDWPQIDRAAWTALFREGDIFDEAGLARHWRPATRKTNERHYARWLAWLCRQGPLRTSGRPTDRLSEAFIKTYAADLIETVAPCTAASTLIGLKEVVRLMAPEEDWRWLKDMSNRLNTWAKPSVDRRAAMRSVEEINQAASAELDRLQATPLRRRLDRVAYRDTLIVLLLSACPIRLRNLSSIRIGHHLREQGPHWGLRFNEAETKTGQRLDHVLPSHFGAYLSVYLAQVRPSFGPAPDCNALWLGFQGGPLTQHSIYGRIILVTERLFGTPINPHLFRSCAATSLVEAAPEAARLAAPLLGHRHYRTTNRYYVKADQLLATRRITSILDDLMDELEEEDA